MRKQRPREANSLPTGTWLGCEALGSNVSILLPESGLLTTALPRFKHRHRCSELRGTSDSTVQPPDFAAEKTDQTCQVVGPTRRAGFGSV